MFRIRVQTFGTAFLAAVFDAAFRAPGPAMPGKDERLRLESVVVESAVDLDQLTGAGESRPIELVLRKTGMDRCIHFGKAGAPTDMQPLLRTSATAMAAHVHVGELLERTVLRTNDSDLVEGVDVIDARVVVAVAMVLAAALEKLFFGDTPGHGQKMPD